MRAASTSRTAWASRDRAGLEDAIWRHLTEMPAHGSRTKRAPMAYAFELWIAHLALLDQMIEVLRTGLNELTAAEMEGILLLRGARERMRREYRACAECGAAVKGKICPRCGALRK